MEMIGLSLLAQIGALPIVAASYNEVSLSGWLANLLVVPALFVAHPPGLPRSRACGACGTRWGPCCWPATGWGIGRIVTVVRVLGETSWAYRALPTPPAPLLACFYLVIFQIAWKAPAFRHKKE